MPTCFALICQQTNPNHPYNVSWFNTIFNTHIYNQVYNLFIYSQVGVAYLLALESASNLSISPTLNIELDRYACIYVCMLQYLMI